MKKILKSILSISLILILVFTLTTPSNAVVVVPQTVRIGLFFTDNNIKINTAVSNFTVSAVKGVQLGTVKDGIFFVLAEEPTGSNITIRKDSYFVNSSGVLKEYQPASTSIPSGERVGPFHIQLGDSFADLNACMQQIDVLKQAGIAAYPAYTDTWQVWTGFFEDEVSAQTYINDVIKPSFTELSCAVLQPSPNRIVALKSTGEPFVVFGSNTGAFQIHPKQENDPYALVINSKNGYRGDLEVRRLSGSDMTVINIVPTEQYLYGVVPAEIGASSPLEALKAQAVAARTYTLAQLGKHGKQFFDLCNTTSCQVYKGLSWEHPASNKAVDETAGKKVLYNGNLASVFYFSSSGGRTEDVVNVWGRPIDYLKSVEDKYESGTTWHYNWETNITSAKVKEKMQARGYDLGEILSMTVTKTSDAGRATELVIKCTKNQAVFSREGTRTVFSLDSQWYQITTDADVSVKGAVSTVKTQLGSKNAMTASGLKPVKGDSNKTVKVIRANGVTESIPLVPTTYKFTGKGWGHAVGMSQDGAKGMAKAGFTYEEILKHYFTGVTIE